MLQIGQMIFDYIGEPPRSPVNRSRIRQVMIEGPYDTQLAVWRFADRSGFTHVFQTERQIGHISAQQKEYLEALEALGQGFLVRTDLLGEEGIYENFTAYFDVSQRPVYQAPIPKGEWWTFQIPLYLIP